MQQLQPSLDVVPSLCLVRPQVRDAESLLRLMAATAEAEGYVLPSFADAVVAREASFPTGLPTPVPAAIPHSDPQHVIRPGLAVALLDPPVDFVEMASDDTVLACRLAVMLLVTTPEAQVEVLGQVIGVLQRADAVEQLEGATGPADLAERFARLLP